MVQRGRSEGEVQGGRLGNCKSLQMGRAGLGWPGLGGKLLKLSTFINLPSGPDILEPQAALSLSRCVKRDLVQLCGDSTAPARQALVSANNHSSDFLLCYSAKPGHRTQSSHRKFTSIFLQTHTHTCTHTRTHAHTHTHKKFNSSLKAFKSLILHPKLHFTSHLNSSAHFTN